MYLQFYGFKEAPFNLTPDSKFLFLSHRHQEALAALLFGVQERKGFICLTGEIGCGKTTLCRAMFTQLDHDQVKTAVVLNSYLTDLELLKTINENFGLPSQSDSKKTLLDMFNDFLIDEFSQGRNVALIIDEAQNLRPETLEQIRMISNLETETAKLIQIVLIGQPELRRTLALPELEQLNQRIVVRYHIAPLDEAEIPEYIRHRLAVAEPQVDVTFAPQAHKLIYHFSRGVPRRINVICDRCLLVGYVQGTFNIDDKIVQRAVAEVRGEMQETASTEATFFEPPPSRGTRWLYSLAKTMAALLVIIGGVMIGLWLAGRGGVPDVKPDKLALASTPKQPAVAPPVEESSLEVAAAVAEPTMMPAPEATATPAPERTSSPTPIPYKNWQYDAQGILRVNSPRLCEAAAYIMLLRQWNKVIDLAPFRDVSPEEVAGYDMLETVKQLNFDAIVSDTLAEALRLDLPVLVRLQSQSELAPWGVIASMRGEVLEFIDPIHGKKMVRRQKLENLTVQAIVLYQDTEGLSGLALGENSNRVLKLQTLLAQKGLYVGALDGKFGQLTREAVVKYQADKGLNETGIIDPLTAAAIAAELNPHRPRLFS